MSGIVQFLNAVFAMTLHATEVIAQQPNRYTYTYCGDQWDARYPYLAEVRYSRGPSFKRFKYHQNRHGVLITNSAVLTRGQDLDGYPDQKQKDLVPVVESWESCHGRTPQGDKACVYVNIRRPERVTYIEGPYCGENIVVRSVIQHPKFGKSAKISKMFENREEATFKQHLLNMKFPFAIAVLAKPVTTKDPKQPFVPTGILPRSPLDFLYWLRRVDTLGPESSLCEYPTYESLRHEGYYSRYSRPEQTVIRLRKKAYRNYPYVLCPDDWGVKGKGFEGKKAPISAQRKDSQYQRVCNATLIENTLPYSFLIWSGPHGTFDEVKLNRDGSKLYRIHESNGRLGAPIVCDGVTVGITSTWAGRGRGQEDVYIGTTLMRVYGWLIKNMHLYNVFSYHRLPGDSPFLGKDYKFKRRDYKKRNYDQSIFELSDEEQILPFAGSQRIEISQLGTLQILLFSVHWGTLR